VVREKLQYLLEHKARRHQSEKLSIPSKVKGSLRGIIDNSASQNKYGVKFEEDDKANGNGGDSRAKTIKKQVMSDALERWGGMGRGWKWEAKRHDVQLGILFAFAGDGSITIAPIATEKIAERKGLSSLAEHLLPAPC
jgi:hypothetical protein